MRNYALAAILACILAVPFCFAPAGASRAGEAGAPESPPAAKPAEKTETSPVPEQTGNPETTMAAKTADPEKEPAQLREYRSTFETDGKGGLYFEDRLRTQQAYAGVTDHVIQGSLEPNFFFIIHYPQGWGEKADAEVRRFVQKLAGEQIFAFHDSDTPQAEFFSRSHAKPEAVEAHLRAIEDDLRNSGLTREEYDFEDWRIFPLFVSYAISESPGARSVNFKIWAYAGGAHDNWTYHAVSLDKATGEPITPDRLFAAPGSFKRLKRWLSTTKDAGYYHEGSCVTGESTLERTGIDLDSEYMKARGLTMDRLVFTPEGLEAVFAPYEQGSFAMGDVRAPIPLKTLRALGVSGRYWQAVPTRPPRHP